MPILGKGILNNYHTQNRHLTQLGLEATYLFVALRILPRSPKLRSSQNLKTMLLMHLYSKTPQYPNSNESASNTYWLLVGNNGI